MLNTKTLPKKLLRSRKFRLPSPFPQKHSILEENAALHNSEKENMNHKYYSQPRCPTNLVKTTGRNSQA